MDVQCELYVFRAYNVLPGHSTMHVALKSSNRSIATKTMPVEAGEVQFGSSLKMVGDTRPLHCSSGGGWFARACHTQPPC
jgi:hypothetical protein